MQKTIKLILLLTTLIHSADIYVAPYPYGNDTAAGTVDNPIASLQHAQELIIHPGSETYNVILIKNPNDPEAYIDAVQDNSVIIWTKSGTEEFPINIHSQAEIITVKGIISAKSVLMKLENVSNVNISRIHFIKNTAVLDIHSSENIAVTDCIFEGEDDNYEYGTGFGAISINGSEISPTKYCKIEHNYMKLNNIMDSICKIEVLDTTTYDTIHHSDTFEVIKTEHYRDSIYYKPKFGYYHGIYITRHTEYNSIKYNTLIIPKYQNHVIYFNHEFQNNNSIYSNYVYKEQDNSVMAASSAIHMSYDSLTFIDSVYDNSICNNYIYLSDTAFHYYGDGPGNAGDIHEAIVIRGDLADSDHNNTSGNNLVHYGNDADPYTLYDPYWQGYDPNAITGRIVSGNFDGIAGDDIAAFYKYNDFTSKAHLWKFESSNETTHNFLKYSGSDGWIKQTGYYSDYFKNTLVSGNFDGITGDDIANFYPYNNNVLRIHTWLSQSPIDSFGYTGGAGWWESDVSGYLIDKIRSRVISGDFNDDGKDDILACYKTADFSPSMHVWCSNGTSFENYKTWWEATGYYVDYLNGTMVSGNFDGNNGDDIANIYQYNNGNARIHVWTSDKDNNSFIYSGGQGWWNSGESGYYVNRVKNRVVSGDYNNDGKDDIACLYKYTDDKARMHVWLSNGKSLVYEESLGWWRSDEPGEEITFEAENIIEMVSGDFNNDEYDDIVSFSNVNGNIKTHIWLSSGTNFNLSEKHGTPWLWKNDVTF